MRPLASKNVLFIATQMVEESWFHPELLTSSLFPPRNDTPLLPVFITSGPFWVCVHWTPRAEDAGEESQGGRRTSSDGKRLHSGSGNVYGADHGTPAAGPGGSYGRKWALPGRWFSKSEALGDGSFHHKELLGLKWRLWLLLLLIQGSQQTNVYCQLKPSASCHLPSPPLTYCSYSQHIWFSSSWKQFQGVWIVILLGRLVV